MSLNGLDQPAVKEAHEAAAGEPGGWFLLKYASRDEVQLLGRGNDGIVGVRNAITEYTEASPLYGFLRYRRRNVIIKYLPDDCSRLVQARVTVHFTAISERFSPYDTTFSIGAAKELKDTKLSAACSLHAASGSTSSSTSSLRRRRLVEIAEEEEEEQRASKRQSVVQEDGTKSPDAPVSPSSPSSSPPPVTLNADLAASPEESNFASTAEPPNFVGVPRPPSPAKSFDVAPRRMSSQSTRPELYNYASYGSYGKQKVKLAPRPSLDVSGRPRTATGNFRPISTIPAGFKLFSKGSKKGKGKDSSSDSADSTPQEEIPEITFVATNIPIPDAPPIPRDPDAPRPHTSSGRPATSTGASTINFSMPTLKMGPPAKEKMTPEKARLMKAMQLREKKKKMSMLQPLPVPTIQPPQEDQQPEGSESVEEDAGDGESTENTENTLQTEADQDDRLSISKADSGIVMDSTASTMTDQASELTHTDSRPASPVMASSEPDQSTKASSLSESTDETIQAKYDDKDDVSEIGDEESTPDAQPAEAMSSMSVIMGEDSPTLEPNPPVIQQLETRLNTDIQTAVREELSPVCEAIEESDSEVEIATPARVNVALPISKFSTNIPVATQPFEEPLEAGMHGETSTAPEKQTAAFREEAETPKTPQLRIPKSKFSTQDLKETLTSTPAPAPTPPVPSIVSPPPEEVKIEEKAPLPEPEPQHLSQESETATKANPEGEAEAEAERREPELRELEPSDLEPSELDTASIHSKVSKRKTIIEPIKTDLDLPEKSSGASHSLSDDEDLLDELQSATVQEAKPMFVSKTPMTPIIPGAVKDVPSSPSPSRTVSQPAVRGALLTPTDVPPQSGTRSISSGAAFLHKITQQQSGANLAPKPGKLGSSISQRIKALEKLSGGSGGGGGGGSTGNGMGSGSGSGIGSLSASPDVVPRSNVPSSTFFSVRKSTIREPSRSPSVADRANSFSKQSPPSTDVSRESSPEATRHGSRDRSGSVASRLSMFEQGPGLTRGRPESIQVTARIVRDASQPVGKMPEPRDPNDYTPLDLKQSPLVVDLQKAEPAPMPESTPAPVEVPKETIQERRMSKEKRRSESRDRANEGASDNDPKPRRSSLSIVKDFIKERRKSLTSPSTDALAAPSPATPSRSPSRPPSTHQNTSYPRRLSISSRRSSISRETITGGGGGGALSPSIYTETSGSGDESKSANGDRKSKSRAGRFMRRLSASLSGSRGKNMMTPTGISPTLHEEDSAETVSMMTTESRPGTNGNGPTIVAYMGDVNVQFPDNLLWKRRSMCLDSQGFLILSTIAATAAPKDKQPAGAGVKRYHLSEFRSPYTPEMEVQELPNSVVLDFVEGSGLQIACEDRAGQLNVLHILQDAHQGHSSFGQ